MTKDINRALRVSMCIETGRVSVNTYNRIPDGDPFGGYKESGIGCETHKVIQQHYAQTENILVNMNEAPTGIYPVKQGDWGKASLHIEEGRICPDVAMSCRSAFFLCRQLVVAVIEVQ